VGDFISQEEIDELVKSGAKISHDKEKVEIVGLQDLVQKLSDIISSNKQISESQNQQTQQMLSSIIEKLSSSGTIDTAPIATAIAGFKPHIIQSQNKGFVFDIVRNDRNLITSIKAEPVK